MDATEGVPATFCSNFYLTAENKEINSPSACSSHAVIAAVQHDDQRLPNPCPLPTSLSKRVQKSLERGILSGQC